jgi:hypothetical protein
VVWAAAVKSIDPTIVQSAGFTWRETLRLARAAKKVRMSLNISSYLSFRSLVLFRPWPIRLTIEARVAGEWEKGFKG